MADLGAAAPAAERRTLTGAACVAGVLTLVAAGIESPTDREPELNQGALATAALLVVLAVGAALAAARRGPGPASGWRPASPWRRWSASGWSVPSGPATRLLPEAALGAVLLTGVTLLAWDWPGGRPIWRHHAWPPSPRGGSGGVPAGHGDPHDDPAADRAATFTALAGNSPINAADSDLLVSLCGLLRPRLGPAGSPTAGHGPSR